MSSARGISSEGSRGDRLLFIQPDTIAAGITAPADLLCPTGKELVDTIRWTGSMRQIRRRADVVGKPAILQRWLYPHHPQDASPQGG